MISYGLFILGLALLIAGSHFLIRSLISLSLWLRIKLLYVSLVVLGFATSSSEWFVTFMAAYRQASELALSNVIGSNTINILLVLGLSGLIYTFKKLDDQILKFHLPCLISFLIFVGFLSYDGLLGFIDCIFVLGIFVIYMYWLFQIHHKEQVTTVVEPQSKKSILASVVLLILSFLGLLIGSHLMIDHSLKIGTALGLSERFMGFFILAIGTSLPELATSISAALKKQGDMVIGNIIGSNIFNTLFIVGSAGLLQSVIISPALYTDYFFMLAISLFLWLVLYVFKGIPKGISVLFLMIYCFYTYFFFWRLPLQ